MCVVGYELVAFVSLMCEPIRPTAHQTYNCIFFYLFFLPFLHRLISLSAPFLHPHVSSPLPYRSATSSSALTTPPASTRTVTKPTPEAFKMMQISSDSASNKHSLINVMHRFIAAANNMDETIMVPSLLRDVPLEGEQAASAAGGGEMEPNNNNNNEPPCPNKQRDMYEHYLLLKSIKNDMEWGLLKREMSSGASFLEMAVKQEEQQPVTGDLLLDDNSDLEHQFHYHLRGLFGVLSKLTLQADDLTNRYKREIGGGNFMR